MNQFGGVDVDGGPHCSFWNVSAPIIVVCNDARFPIIFHEGKF